MTSLVVAPPEPEFRVLGARRVRHAAAPMLALDLEIREESGQQVYMIALGIQLMIEPARRAYDAETRARLVELFGEPERWAVTTRSLVWSHLDVLVPAFTGATTVTVPIACHYDLELAAAKYLYSLPGGEAPLALHFTGTIYYRDDRGGLQMVRVPWSTSIDFRMPVSVWRETVEHYYPNTAWVAVRTETLAALADEKLARGLTTLDATLAQMLTKAEVEVEDMGAAEGIGVPDPLDQLIESLLWEGYALYPYTPGATKNATPTPFGIVYPPAYAAEIPTTHDELVMRCRLAAPADAAVSAEVRFLAATGERHQAEEHRLGLGGVMVGALVHMPAVRAATIRGANGGALEVEITLGAAVVGSGEFEVTVAVRNRTDVAAGLDRAGALARSLISTHPVARVSGGRFISVLEAPTVSVNTFPVLVSSADDVVLGAAIVLPEHPQIAPESRGGLFDSTEIEEALLLHLQVLSDGEREEIERQDAAVRAMVARAAAATPAEISALHGRVTVSDPVEVPSRPRETVEPPREPAWLRDPREGEAVTEVGGAVLRRGAKVRLAPGPGADLQARMLTGRSATLERIFTDYDGRTHLGVTVDGDPGQDLMRESGRYLFFFLDEVEVLPE